MHRTHALLVSVVLGLGGALVAAVPVRAQTPAADPRTLYNGTFQHVGAGDEATVQQAIETAINGMSFIAVPIARARLRERNTIAATIAFAFPTRMIQVTFAGRPPTCTPDDGSMAVLANPQGGTRRVSQRFERSTLVQEVATDQGARRIDFIPQSDGSSLQARVTITSPSLPRAVTYSLAYRR